MVWSGIRTSLLCAMVTALATVGLSTRPALGQGGNNNNGFGIAGIEIDAEGVLRQRIVQDPRGLLTRQRIAEAEARLDADLVRVSRLRKVSLNRLEKAVAERLGRGLQPTDDMLNLAGLTSIEYVFYYPETRDIVIAGPAEGFFTNPVGRSVGMSSGKATLQLQDLIVALRAYSPEGRPTGQIGCSIDPTEEGLQAMQRFLASLGRISPNDANRIAEGMRQNLGLQEVSIQGISPNTHFAQVLVEADYRMKLIGIGLETPTARIRSFVSRANPRDGSANAMQRWFFTPDYECLLVSEDNLAMQLIGDRVKLLSEAEMVTGDGERVRSGSRNGASEGFCAEFTERYGQLAERTPVYAQLRHLIDMSIVAAYIQHQDYYAQAGWDLGVFADESQLPVETHAAPTQVESAVNVVWKGNTLMTPIGGGVEIHASRALSDGNLSYDSKGEVSETWGEAVSELAEGQWWWD